MLFGLNTAPCAMRHAPLCSPGSSLTDPETGLPLDNIGGGATDPCDTSTLSGLDKLAATSCNCIPRSVVRAGMEDPDPDAPLYYIEVGRGDVLMIDRGDVVSLRCNKPDRNEWAEPQPTPADVQCFPFISKGNGYVYFFNGVPGHEFTLILWINDGSSTYDTRITLNFRITA